MTDAAIMKPVRVIRELSDAEKVMRAEARARQIRDAAWARADATYIESLKDALAQYLQPATPTESSG
jgi:hypothetical protein